MSDNWIYVVPGASRHIPEIENQAAAADVLVSLTPLAGPPTCHVTPEIEFYDCGSNLENVSCPSCHAVISFDWWGEMMSCDSAEPGFAMASYPAPCCGTQLSLNELVYDGPQAFASFAIELMNPGRAAFSEPELRQISDAMGCDIRVVYRHL